MKMNAKEKNPKSSPARAGEREALRTRFRNFRQLSERTRLWAEARDRQAAQLSRLQALPISPGRQAAVTAAKLARLRALTCAWAASHEVAHCGLRIDVVSIELRPGLPAVLRHHRGVGL